MNWFHLVLVILASYRLTHLVVFDSITEPARMSVARVPFAGELVTCYWCAGVWVSGLLLAGYYAWPAFFGPAILVLAVAAGQALLETWSRQE